MKTDRVLGRIGARELTKAELETVNGGKKPKPETYAPCTWDGVNMDGEC
jgi:hypothetical protein